MSSPQNLPKKILLTHSYFYKFDEKQWATQKPYPPYNTILVAALLRSKGYEVCFFDTNLINSPAEILPLFQNFSPDYFVVYDDSFNYLSKMCLTNMREACFEMISFAKEYGCTVFVNSSDATDHFDLFLNKGADAVLYGEGEETLLAILATSKDKWIDCLGTTFKANGEIIKTIKRAIKNNLDDYPQPAWDLVNIAGYKNIWLKSHGYFSLNIATTRGCPFKCNWCAKPIYGNRYNTRSPQNIANELHYLMTTFGATHFWVCDDIFGLKPGWVKDFAKALKDKNVKPKLKIQCRADLLLKDDTIKNLVEAGLDEVWMGAESGSQKILDAMDKGTTIAQIYEASTLLKKYKIKVCLFIQYGYLGETKEDIESTFILIKNILPYDIGISVSYPLPGTVFYEKVKLQLAEKQNWSDSNDLTMMYNANFNAAFYKQLHKHTHLIFKIEKGLASIKYFEINKDGLRNFVKLPYYYYSKFKSEKSLQILQTKS